MGPIDWWVEEAVNRTYLSGSPEKDFKATKQVLINLKTLKLYIFQSQRMKLKINRPRNQEPKL